MSLGLGCKEEKAIGLGDTSYSPRCDVCSKAKIGSLMYLMHAKEGKMDEFYFRNSFPSLSLASKLVLLW